MAEDFDDFGDFASAFPTTSGVNDANTALSASASAIKQDNSADKVDFLASFPPPISSTSGDTVPLDFTSFGAFSNHTSEGAVDGGEISDFGRFDVANMDLSELKIPSPTDPNIHMVGGVAFDIPPILDDDFSNPSSPTVPPNQVQFQGDLFSADFTAKVVANREVKESDSNVHLSFPTTTSSSGSQQSSVQTAQEDKKDDSFGDFESSVSLKPITSGLKTAAEPSNVVEGGNVGLLFPAGNSIPAVGGNAREMTNSGQIQGLEGDLKLSDDLGEFGDFTQSAGVDKTETSGITNLGNSLDAVGFPNFGSTVNAESEAQHPDTSTADDPLPPSGDVFLAGFNHSQPAEPTERASQDNTQQFGDFGAFSSSSTVTTQQGAGFGDFQTQSGSSATAAQDDGTQGANFSAFSTTSDALVNNDFAAATDPQGDAQFGDFGTFSSSSTTGVKDDAEFGNFSGGFQAPATDSTTTAQSDTQFGDFGAFSSSNTVNTKEDGFGSFGAFQTESNSTAVPSSTANTLQGDDFGAFGDSTGKDDDFGDFSTSDSGFGNFASSEPTPTVVSNNAILKGIENVIGSCFPGAGSSQDKQIPLKTIQLTSQLTSPSKSPESSENDPPLKVWTTLQRSIDFTVPLKKWDSSYMQDYYYMALKMDPKLVSKAGILPLFNGMGQFGAPLGGVTALDLLESFGFEGGLEAVTHEPSSPTSTQFPFRSGSPGPALLDLSLPTSPKSPTNKNASFTLDADLLGLDLNPQSQGKPLTSIQELVLNERLVVNRSTWMDSELLELGGSSGGASGNQVIGGDSTNSAVPAAGEGDTSSTQQTSSSSSQPSTPRIGKKQNSIELQLLQLGLDASKTTLSSVASHAELSLTARSTLGRLPDLSFMLQGDKIVRSTYQSGPSAS